MQPEQFSSRTRRFVRKSHTGYWYFSPPPLPPELDLDWNIARLLSEADRAVSSLAGLAENLPNPKLLAAPFIRQEAVMSSRIEGTHASLSELFFFEAAGVAERGSDVQEVANYVRALEHAFNRLDTLPLSGRLLREMHEILMTGVRGQHLTPGLFRTSQNWIGPSGCTLDNAPYVPPHPHEMVEAISDLEKFIHSESGFPPLIRIALLHYQFEAIHPFLDGNGRIGRLLISLMLFLEGLLPQPILNISAYIETHRSEYYDKLLAVTVDGDWTGWIKYFLIAISSQAETAKSKAVQIADLRHSYRSQLLASNSPPSVLQLLELLFTSPAVSITQAANHLGSTRRTAQLGLQRLEAAGFVAEATGNKRYRIFLACEILRILES